MILLRPGMAVRICNMSVEAGPVKNGDRVILLKQADCFCCWLIEAHEGVEVSEEGIRPISPLELLAEIAE